MNFVLEMHALRYVVFLTFIPRNESAYHTFRDYLIR